MKRVVFIVCLLIFSTYNLSFADDLSLNGESAILIDADTGQILYEKSPHMKLHPASTTKIMTGILALEHGNMYDIVTVDDEVVQLTKGSHIALEPDERLVFEDLLNALLIESANDSALAIAKHLSGSIEEFANLMNDKAKELGAMNTNFVNPNGLTDEEHLTTAYDLSLMAQYAMENEAFREIVSNHKYTIPKTNKKDEERHLWSSNKMLFSTEKINVDGNIIPTKYDGITGVKTGYTTEAGFCLVGSAKRGDQNLIGVVLKSNNNEIFADMHKLLNYGFDEFDKTNIAIKDQFIDNIGVKNGTIPVVAGVIKENLNMSIHKDSLDNIDEKISVPDNLEAPIKDGQVLGKVEYYVGDKLIGSSEIISTLNIEAIPSPSILERILDRWYFILIGLLIILRYISIVRRKKRRRKRRFYRVPNSYQ